MKLQPKNLVLLALLCICALLYFPWRSNPLVFDDLNMLKSTALFDYAQQPFSIFPRQFPYFTLGFESVISDGNIGFSRCVTLALHAINGFLLFLIGHALLKKIVSPRHAFISALSIAVIFVVHPVAVYAAAYLIQRTILFATFFLLLSAVQFDKALSERSWHRALVAGVCYGCSVLSKEHALSGLVGVMGILLINRTSVGKSRANVVIAFLATALPFALWVASLKLGYVGNAYEPDARELLSAAGFPDRGSAFGNWILSASLQCWFFFRYLGFWYWPDPSALSIDVRPDFSHLSNYPWIALGPLFMVCLVGTVAFLLWSPRMRPAFKLIAYGLLWALGLFLIELSSVRFQEPIVLYRSYLWAPGFLLAIAGLLCLVPVRVAWAVCSLVILACIPLSWQRLNTFSDELLLWQEAAAKLPDPTTPGAIRIHYNLGVFHSRAGQMNEALEDFEWVIRQDPQSFSGYWGRSTVWAAKNELLLAAGDLEKVIKLKPGFGIAYYQYGLVLKAMGRTRESESALAKSKALGVPSITKN